MIKIRIYDGKRMIYHNVRDISTANDIIAIARHKGYFAEIIDERRYEIKQYSVVVRKGVKQ